MSFSAGAPGAAAAAGATRKRGGTAAAGDSANSSAKPQREGRELTAANLANQRSQPFQARMPSSLKGRGNPGDGVPLGREGAVCALCGYPGHDEAGPYTSPLISSSTRAVLWSFDTSTTQHIPQKVLTLS